jgi:hypothetical protein
MMDNNKSLGFERCRNPIINVRPRIEAINELLNGYRESDPVRNREHATEQRDCSPGKQVRRTVENNGGLGHCAR